MLVMITFHNLVVSLEEVVASDSIKEGDSIFDNKVSGETWQLTQTSQYRHSRQKTRDLMDMADNPYYSMLP